MVNSSIACCAVLSKLLGNKVSFPGSSAYTDSLASYYAQQEEEIRPGCVVTPTTSQDVSTAVARLSSESTCLFAVRSGGHTMNAGSANIQAGVTIDLSSLNSVTVSGTGDNVVSIGAGAAWSYVYTTLEPLGLAVAGGRAAGVGVGGLSLGGGLSWFSPRYGWTFDSIVNYEVVLANGSIVAAQDNNDLMISLRGGGNNFGVVTGIDIQGFEQGLVWGGFLWQPVSSIDDVIAEFVQFNSAADYDIYASMDTAIVYSASTGSLIGSQPVYTKPVENPDVYSGLLSLPTVSSTLRITNLTDLAAETASLSASGLRSNYHEITLLSTSAVLTSAWQIFNASIPSISGVDDISWSMVFEAIPPAIYARYAQENSLGLQTRDSSQSLVVVLLMASWTSASDDKTVYSAVQDLSQKIKTSASALGALDPYVYLNYADLSQQPIQTYGSESLARLRRVQKQVDPKNVFTRQVPGGFKIPG